MPSLSISARLIISMAFALAAFLGAAGVGLDRAFNRSAVEAINLRLQSYFYSYLQGTDFARDGRLVLPEVLPESKFERPGSGLYAAVFGPKNFRWYSPSALGREDIFEGELKPGEYQFSGPVQTRRGGIYVYRHGVSFDAQKGAHYTFFVAEHASSLTRQKRAFRGSLLTWLLGLGGALIVVTAVLLRLALRPLRGVAQDLSEVERGEHEQLNNNYPRELRALTRSINGFIRSERESLKRYRNTLGDLAHSLKTPLAVVRGLLDGSDGQVSHEARADSIEQLSRMDSIIAYQLARARASGHQTYAAPLPVESNVLGVVETLEKLHAERGIICEFDIDPQARFHGELGDLMELLGNLLENAFKWGRARVLLSAKPISGPRVRRAGLKLVVEDDGPGIEPDKVEALLRRGVRGDERTPGHGIGLSIVNDIVASYDGDLKVLRAEELGGARFEITLPPLMEV
jgi:two-component system sensor histidine kinase PhoQ